MEIEFSRQILEKYWDIKFCENQSVGIRVVACGRTDGRTDRKRSDMTKLIVAFSNFANAPKNDNSISRFFMQQSTHLAFSES